MADIKILDLTEATEITETTDYIPVVDTSDTTQDSTGTTKKATVRKLLGDRVLPDTIVGTTETQTLTNKTLTSPVINTPTGDVVTPSGTQTLTNKTLTSPVINTPTGDVVTPTGTQTLTNKTLTSPVIDTQVSGTAVLDEDTMSSNSDKKLATQQSIKAYVDSGKAGASYINFLTTEQSTTSSAQIGSAQVTVTTKGGNLLIIGTATIKTSAATSGLILEIDGSDVSGASSLTNSTNYIPSTVVYVKTGLSAGSHTIKLKCFPQAGNTVYVAAYHNFCLAVAEL